MVRSSASGSASFTATRHRAYRIGTPRGEWQCDRYARGRVAVHPTLPLGGERTGRRIPHCHSASSVPRRHDQGRVAVRPHCHSAVNVRDGTFKCEWQCVVHCHSTSSVPYWYAQGRVAVRSVRSGASGSASHTATRCRAYRVAVRPSILEAPGEVLGEAPGEVLRKAPGEVLSFRITTKAGPAFCETCLPWTIQAPVRHRYHVPVRRRCA